MAFTDLFIRRPVLATVVSLLILLIGAQAGVNLPVRQYPELSNTTITVTTVYPGANSDVIKGFITTPIEQAVASAEGIDTLVSSSQQNVSTVTLNLRLDADPDRAVADVLSKVNQVQDVLPREANDPVVQKQTGEGFALMYLSFNSEQMGASQITDYITRVVQPALQTVPGVANAQILGGQTFAMRIWLDPVRMAAFDVTPAQISAALAANNYTTAAGQLKSAYTQTSIDAVTSLNDADAFGQLVIANRDDTLIRISDVAEVELGPENVDSSTEFDGLKAVFIGIFATPSANPLTVISDIRAAFPRIQAQLPPAIEGAIAYDATEFIRASINEVALTLGEAAVIVIVVIFLFLGDLRSTLIPIVTIPLSLIGVLMVLLALGYSINLMTLLALVLAIGLVVDDAIVVVENIYRHVEDGMQPFAAALRGAREIAMPVVSMTITLAAVYAPIGFVGGLTGALFAEFAFTLAGAVFVSGIIALTLSPMMCSLLLRHRPVNAEGRTRGFAGLIDRGFGWMQRRYQRRLHRTLNFRAMTMLVLLAVIVMTGLLYITTPQELAPEEDQGVLFALLTTPQYANLDYLEQSTAHLREAAGQIPENEHLFAINGLGNVHSGFAGMIFRPWDQRERGAKEILQSLQPLLGTIPGAQVLAFSPPSLPGSTGGTPVQFVVTTIGDYRQLAEVIQELQIATLQSGMFIFTDIDLRFDTPQVRLTVNQDKANLLGVTMADIGTTLSTLLGGNYVNRFDLYGRSYQVIPQVPRSARETSEWLGRYRVRTTGGEQVPLSTVAEITATVQPNALTTFQQLNSATLSGVPFPGRTLGEALEYLQATAPNILPEGFSWDYQGQSRQYIQEGSTLVVTFVFALVVIFLVLAGQFESFRDPFTILIALPTAMFGALLPLNVLGMMGGASINIYSQIGLVTLIGLISKHGILMVDFANKLQEQGHSRREAIEMAAAIRLRPILMTTAAMVVAMVPLLTASGAGAESRFNIGMVIAFGMTIGTMFTLFVTPAVYTFVARDHSRKRGEEAVAAPAS